MRNKVRMYTTHTIIHGDSRSMKLVPDKSVHLVITSPPYWQLKDYGSENQIEFNDSYENYINNLNLVWKESFRVLHDGCRLCVNIGDQFARSVYYGRYKIIPIHAEIIHKIDKKIDVKSLQFGSKIDAEKKQSDELFSVTQIISPELLTLSNGLTVRLIGIKTNPELLEPAKEYLTKKISGKKVFLKFDQQKYDDENNLLVYLYLENKTFINAHLLKEKMVFVDNTYEHKYKLKFKTL